MFPPRTAGDIEAEILMNRQAHKGSFLLVEGPDDSKFWRGRKNQDCEIVLAEGKQNLLGAIQKLDSRQFPGALGIIDDDYDSLEDRRYPSCNLLVTEVRDLECMLLRSPALERVLAELGNPVKIQSFEEQAGLSIRAKLLENGLIFGRLRWLDKRQTWGLNFDKLAPSRFIDRKLWCVDKIGLFESAASAAGLKDADELKRLLHTLPHVDPWLICQGHGLIEILRLGLQEALGDQKSSYGKSNISSNLRLAFHAAELTLTQLYRDICDWERNNTPFRILPAAT